MSVLFAAPQISDLVVNAILACIWSRKVIYSYFELVAPYLLLEDKSSSKQKYLITQLSILDAFLCESFLNP